MESVRSSTRSADSIVATPEQDDTLQSSPPPAVAAALPLQLPSIKKPHKLTPLERKERDHLRMKEQSQRRKQAAKDQYEQAKRFVQAKMSTSTWHQQERMEEELVLRRLERDVVDAQRSHPAAAGYTFDHVAQTAAVSPVFYSFSHALCPPSQASRLQLKSRSGLQRTTNIPTEAEYLHPACHGYVMSRNDDSSCLSPVFFFSGFAKIPLDQVVMKQDDVGSDESDEEDEQVGNTMFDAILEMDGSHELSGASKARQQENQRRLEAAMAARALYSKPLDIAEKAGKASAESPMCLVCKKTATTVGCPGCFTFSSKKYLEVEAFKATQRIKTPMTALQEQEELRARHKALQRQMIIPPLLPKLHQSLPGVFAQQTNVQEGENDFYSGVLPDFRAIRIHRALSNNFITLHVKSLPVGQLISLRVDLKSSVSYLYELYRANTELPNRPLHLLLPTTHGLFYLDEHVASATYTRNGVVNGELLLEDFNLQKSTLPSRSGHVDTTDDSNASSEFLLFAVAILHPQSTPQLILNYVQQNFYFKPPENRSLIPLVISVDSSSDRGGLPQWTRLVPATFLLPKAVDQDPFQLQIRPHIHAMHVFAKTNYAIVAAEQREERERLLLLAHQEAKAAKLALKKKLRDQQTPSVSNKVRRALAYFEFVCENTSNPRQPRVAEERLGKLWQLMQLLEEWKIMKGGRLMDAERSDVMLSLLQELKETAALAFSQMLHGAKSLKTDKGGGTLPYPVLCLDGGGSTRKLVLRLGTRMGVTQQDDYDYGLVLDLDHDFGALERAEPRMMKRGYTKRVVSGQDPQDGQQVQAVEAWTDVEWRAKAKGSSTMALLVSSSDLLSPPFHRIKWTLIAKAYKLVLKRVAFVNSKLDEFNAFAKLLQSPDAVLSKAQLAKWQADVEVFLATLHENTALARAVQRVLSKKGVSVLKRRAQARRKQLRDREKELERLKELQLERERPKLTLAQQLKVTFIKERAPKLREALELTPAEKLGAKAGEILGKAASSVAKAARKAKKEYAVRTL